MASETKNDAVVGDDSVDLDGFVSGAKAGTVEDQSDMHRMGKTQELRVCKPFLPTLCLRALRID